MSGKLTIIVSPDGDDLTYQECCQMCSTIRGGGKAVLTVNHGLALPWFNFLLRFGILDKEARAKVGKQLKHPVDAHLLWNEVCGYEIIDGELVPMRKTVYGLVSVSLNRALDVLDNYETAIDEVSK